MRVTDTRAQSTCDAMGNAYDQGYWTGRDRASRSSGKSAEQIATENGFPVTHECFWAFCNGLHHGWRDAADHT